MATCLQWYAYSCMTFFVLASQRHHNILMPGSWETCIMLVMFFLSHLWIWLWVLRSVLMCSHHCMWSFLCDDSQTATIAGTSCVMLHYTGLYSHWDILSCSEKPFIFSVSSCCNCRYCDCIIVIVNNEFIERTGTRVSTVGYDNRKLHRSPPLDRGVWMIRFCCEWCVLVTRVISD